MSSALVRKERRVMAGFMLKASLALHAGFYERPTPAIAGAAYRKQIVLFLTDTLRKV